jgi:hypothetical protein
LFRRERRSKKETCLRKETGRHGEAAEKAART